MANKKSLSVTVKRTLLTLEDFVRYFFASGLTRGLTFTHPFQCACVNNISIARSSIGIRN